MRQQILNLFTTPRDMSWEDILLNIVLAAVLGFFIFLSYAISHRGTIYSRKFNASLVILAVLTGTVMTVIGNNIALSLGMVGALSIVRFRTAIKDSRDTVYIFLVHHCRHLLRRGRLCRGLHRQRRDLRGDPAARLHQER